MSGRVNWFGLLTFLYRWGGEDLVAGRSVSESEEEADSYSESDASVSVWGDVVPCWVLLISLIVLSRSSVMVVIPLVTLWTYLSVIVQGLYAGTRRAAGCFGKAVWCVGIWWGMVVAMHFTSALQWQGC